MRAGRISHPDHSMVPVSADSNDGMDMNALMRTANDLLSYWRRYDWRESFFAPNFRILQALTVSGKTASGAGHTRESAFQRCLGETAELHALARLATNSAGPDTGRIGLAAHPDPEWAHRGAILEAFERFAAIRWWQGHMPALPLDSPWLEQEMLIRRMERARLGAALKRRTGWWRIATPPDSPHVIICRSMSAEGQDILLGFGADPCPAIAARKALRELLLMEMNLMELLAARSVGQEDQLRPLSARIASYTRICPLLLAERGAITPTAEPPLSFERAGEWFGATLRSGDITPPDGPISVWMCDPDLPSIDSGGPDRTPFM